MPRTGELIDHGTHPETRARTVGRPRYIDEQGRERLRSFTSKTDAENFLKLTEATDLRGAYVDRPRAGSPSPPTPGSG